MILPLLTSVSMQTMFLVSNLQIIMTPTAQLRASEEILSDLIKLFSVTSMIAFSATDLNPHPVNFYKEQDYLFY